MKRYLILNLLLFLLCTHAHSQEQGFINHQHLKPKAGKMNISVFIYRDINRNGVYDLADRPYAGQAVVLHRPKGGPSMRVSNISGFTNFQMSLANPKFPIRYKGNYRISAVPNKEWQITSNNAEQDLHIEELSGSPAGLIAKQTLKPIGLAPKLFVRGLVSKGLIGTELLAHPPAGESKSITVEKDGRYEFLAEPGHWTLELRTLKGKILKRSFEVRDTPTFLSRWNSDNTYAESVEAEKITFDDLTSSDTLYEIPNRYGNLGWENWIATHHKFYKGSGYVNNTTSGEYIAYNSSGHPASIHSDKVFDLIGVNLGVAWPKAENSPVRIRAWRDSELLYEDEIMAKVAGPLFFAAGYKEVTKVEFSTAQYWQVVVDDLQVKTLMRNKNIKGPEKE
jgi:hypothetical protein